MGRHHQIAWPLPAAFHDVDFGRPPAVRRGDSERRRNVDTYRYLRTDVEICILLRKPTLGRQDARYVFIVEEHRLQFRRRAGCNNRENSISNLERIEPQRSCRSSAIAWIHIYLLFAVKGGFPFEVGAVSSPVARFRPGGAAGVVRHPPVFQQWMLVEIIVERAVQGHLGKGIGFRRADATTLFAGRIARHLQGQPRRRGLEMLLRKSRRESDETTDHGQDFRSQVLLSSVGSRIDRQAFLHRNYTIAYAVSSCRGRPEPGGPAFFLASCGFTCSRRPRTSPFKEKPRNHPHSTDYCWAGPTWLTTPD